jgi:hypothetical protein
MALVDQKRWLDFRVSDNDGNPVAGLHLTDFTVIFTRDNAPCADGLLLVDCTGGRYILTYTPSALGHDYVELYYAPTTSWPLMDGEDIVDSSGSGGGYGAVNTVVLTENYGGTGRLKPSLPNPGSLTLYVITSEDWQAGRQTASAARYWTAITSSGDWATPEITVTPDTYHFVAWDQTGRQQVVAAFLVVGN